MFQNTFLHMCENLGVKEIQTPTYTDVVKTACRCEFPDHEAANVEITPSLATHRAIFLPGPTHPSTFLLLRNHTPITPGDQPSNPPTHPNVRPKSRKKFRHSLQPQSWTPYAKQKANCAVDAPGNRSSKQFRMPNRSKHKNAKNKQEIVKIWCREGGKQHGHPNLKKV